MLQRSYPALLAVAALVTALPALAAESTDTTQQILDILRQREQITEQQYQDLKKQSGSEFRVYWDKGLNFGTADGQYHIKLGSRLQNDWAALIPDDDLQEQFSSIDGLQTGTEFRRARIQLEGTFYKLLDFKMEFDFANARVAFKDVYLGVRDVPVIGRIRLGHFKEPFSLEQLTSDSHTTFMERSLASSEVFAPDRNTGVAFYRNFVDSRVLWAGGAFREADDSANGFGGDALYNVTTRLSGLPWYQEQGRWMLHLGLSYSHKLRDDDEVEFSQRPESHLAPRLVDTDGILVDGVDILAHEAALVLGPFSLQAEYMHSYSDAPGGNPRFQGFYVYGSWFITGENRPYKVADGAFDRPIPKANAFNGSGGIGAWEVALRYSDVDLDDEGVDGGKLHDLTFGTNWYLNPYFKVMLNYVYANRSAESFAHIVQARFQLDF